MKKVIIFFFMFSVITIYAQVEHVPVTHPVYNYLLHAETKGFLPHFSLSALPLTRSQVVKALELVRNNEKNMSNTEIETLLLFENEFGINPPEKAVVFYSQSDSSQVLSSRLFRNYEKYIYHYSDSTNSFSISPLGSVEAIYKSADKASKVILGNLGIRLYGTIDNMLGYYLQATNGTVLGGDRSLAMEDSRLAHNIKFAFYDSDFDFSESHVRFQYKWFYTVIGKETRLLGAGLNQRIFMSSNAPPSDALSLGAIFNSFEYRYTHGSLLGYSVTGTSTGIETVIPQKYYASHRFALRPSWGEIAFWENIIYSGRDVDLAYLNPLSFMKSLEHSLRDRDNSMMGLDITLRFLPGLQAKASYLLDDIKYSEIGRGYWSNKSAFNFALIAALVNSLDIGVEYARVEPYTFTHFNTQNSMTNDSLLFGGYILPNSDETSFFMQWWWGGRYPVQLKLSYRRHGDNEYDENGKLKKNVGADPLYVKRSEDPDKVVFLDGIRNDVVSVGVQGGMELTRGFNLHFAYTYRIINDSPVNLARIIFRFEDF